MSKKKKSSVSRNWKQTKRCKRCNRKRMVMHCDGAYRCLTCGYWVDRHGKERPTRDRRDIIKEASERLKKRKNSTKWSIE